MIYVILGMHKSGTTLVSQILQHSGINMGESIDASISYDQGNKYERRSTRILNGEILGCNGMEIIDLVAPDTPQLTEEQRGRMREIIQNCNEQYMDWGFKDPRTCLVYPLWAAELPEHKIIVVYRSPAELWLRFRPVHVRNRYRDPFVAWKLMQRWCEHNVNIVNYLQNTQMDFLVLEYQRLMSTQEEFYRLQEFVGIELNDRRRMGLYRRRSSKKFLLLEIAAWLIHKRTTHHPKRIVQQLETLREGCKLG